MAATLASLLRVLDHQRQQLPSAVSPGTEPHALQAWSILAQAALRALTALLVPATADHGAACTALRPLSDELRPGPPLGVYAPLTDIATTLGGIADLLQTPVTTSRAILTHAQQQVAHHALAALRESSAWTVRTLPVTTSPSLLGRQLPRIANLQPRTDPGPIDEVSLHPWRSIQIDDTGLDGTVARWSTVARATLSSEHNVTQLALQLAAADIALICAAAAAAVSAGVRAGVRATTVAREYAATADLLAQASRGWRQAAVWPDHVRLGGRARDLRDASQSLREQITSHLRDGQQWKPGPHLGTPATIASLLWASQTAHHVGVAHEQATYQFANSTPRAWLARASLTEPLESVADQLATARYAWIPDIEQQHAAATVHHASHQACTSTRQALQDSEALWTTSDETAPWETVNGHHPSAPRGEVMELNASRPMPSHSRAL